MAAAMAAVMVILADWLFYDQPTGWTLGLYLSALVAMLLIRPGRGGAGVAVLVAALLLGLAAAMVLQPGTLSVLLAILGLIVLATVRRIGWSASTWHWLQRVARFPAHVVVQPLRDLELFQRWLGRAPGDVSRRRGCGCLAAWFLPVALSLVFIGLFWLANPILGVWSTWLTEWLSEQVDRWAQWLHPLRMSFWMLLAAFVWSLMRMRTRRRRGLPRIPALSIRRRGWLPNWDMTPTVVRCLILFNLVFAGQLLLDARYLLAGAELPEGMTYAEYAHRGAYPLVATALLAGAFVLVTFRSRGPAEQSRTARGLVYLWLGQNLILLASAAWRLRMYVDVYSLTMWRIAAAIWMLLVALGLVWVVVRIVIRLSNIWLLRVNVLTALTVLYACCFVNFAAGIAWFNVTRCQEVGGPGEPIDLVYLERLGPQALPAAQWLARHSRDEWADQRQGPISVSDVVSRLETQLDRQLGNWRSWTLRRQWVASVTSTETETDAVSGDDVGG